MMKLLRAELITLRSFISSEISKDDMFVSVTFICYITCVCFVFCVAVNTPHFLHIKGVEVNAGQTATFHCTVNGEWKDNFNLWLQVQHNKHTHTHIV